MKALTLTQPWATLVAIGAKQWETRSWETPYRGPLAIHAAKGWTSADRRLVREDQFFGLALALAGIIDPEQLPRGAVVAMVDLVSVRFTGQLSPGNSWPQPWIAELGDDERHVGNYSPRRYGWKLSNVRRLREPIPARGALGLWDLALPDNAEAQLECA